MALVRERNAEPIPGYRLIEPLGRGGFGEVWKCEAPGRLHKAIKFVYGNLHALDNEGFRAEQELNALERVKSIRHPFVLSIERVEIINGELLIVMELADRNLHDRLDECQKSGLPGIPREELLAYMRDAAEALDLMNFQHDLQHLDIKPRNLFLVSNRVKVADFGLVKDLESIGGVGGSSTLTGGVTPLYASPETFQGIISRHSDQYSLAIVYQEMLCGVRPFSGKTPRQLMIQHTKDEPDVSPLPEADRPIVLKALSKNPQQRFESCMDFVRALVSGQTQPAARAAAGRAVNGRGGRRGNLAETMEDLFLSPHEGEPEVASIHEDGPGEATPDEAARMSFTVAQPSTGSLRPTVVIGVGAFGKEALQALRCRVVDRFGSLSKLPLLRCLYLDTNETALHYALLGAPEQALTPSELYHLPLQGIGYYRRHRHILDHVTNWLPLEKLYNLPRSLETDGSRALGRLAFYENYNRLAARLRRELQLVCEPETLDQAVQQTGLAIRSDAPQVFVIATAGGGTGSGMLVDLGYALRRQLQELGHSVNDVTALLMIGAPADPATPPAEQANLYATLTELNHFSDPAIEFSAQYKPDGPTLRDSGPPYQAVYLTRMGHRNPEGLRETAARLATYLFQDLTTPLGSRLANSRNNQRAAKKTPFRSFGTYAVWFPRGLMLRVAARQACQRAIESWQAEQTNPEWLREVALSCDQLFTHTTWQAEVLRNRIEEAATNAVDGKPGQALTAFLATLEAQADLTVAREDPAGWCRQALERAREWVGSGVSAIEETSEWRKSRLHRLFAGAVQKVADEYIEYLAQPVRMMFDRPGYRLAAADAAYAHLLARCDERLEQQLGAIKEQMRKTEKCWQEVDYALDACLKSGSFFLFAGKRMSRLLHTFVERLAAYARQRLQEEACRSVQYFYAALKGRLLDLQRDLTFCRQRLRHVGEHLLISQTDQQPDLPVRPVEAGPLTGISHVSSSILLREAALVLASRIVLPEGATDLEWAAARFLERVTPEQWFELDNHLQDFVLHPAGGLHRLCMTSSDLMRGLGTPLLEGAAEYLGRLLPETDVCEAELSAARSLGIDLAAQLRAYHRLATPSISLKRTEQETSYLVVPGSPAGQQIGDLARRAQVPLSVVRVSNATDLLVCREQTNITPADLQELLAPCKKAYTLAATTPLDTPHTRCDILDWIPLDP